MAVLTISGSDIDLPNSQCSSCDMTFNICWNRNLIYDCVEYCPFCGEEIDETLTESERTVMSETISEKAVRFGVDRAICGTCIHFRKETDGDYGEIDCGSFCDLTDPDQEGDGELDENYSCDKWTPHFWHSKFADLIGGELLGDVDESFKAAFDSYYEELNNDA